MKKRCYSSIEIKIDGHVIGYSTITYFYFNGYETDKLLCEITIYPKVQNIKGLILNNLWATIREELINISNPQQVENLIMQMLQGAIINLKLDLVSFKIQRETFYLHINIGSKTHNCFLIHEYSLSEFKQVQIGPNSKVMKFDISKNDTEIIDELKLYLA